jgi:hypothetical protein
MKRVEWSQALGDYLQKDCRHRRRQAMKTILICVGLSLFFCSTASAFQGGSGEATRKAPPKKTEATRKSSGTNSNSTTPAAAIRNVIAYCAAHKNYAGPGEQSEDELPVEVKAAGASYWRCANGKVMVCDGGATGFGCVKTAPADARRMQTFRKFCRESPKSDYIPNALTVGLASEWRCRGTIPVMTGTLPVDRQGYFTDTWRILK